MIIAGHVYVVYTTLTRPPKDKITVCVCAADNLFFWVNTEPRRGGIGQIALTATDHQALTRNCFLDCSRVTTFLQSELDAAQPRGPVSSQLAQRIVDYLRESPPKTLPTRYLKIAIATMEAIIDG